MSLVIIKVDREHNTHSIYSEGIQLYGDSEIMTNNTNKITHIKIGKLDILLGCTGSSSLGRFIRLRIADKIASSELANVLYDIDASEDKLVAIFNGLWEDFCDENELDTSNDSWSECESIMSINGRLFHIELYSEHRFDVSTLDEDFTAVGQGDLAAKCMLSLGIDVQTILDTISKYNCQINNNLKAIENIPY